MRFSSILSPSDHSYNDYQQHMYRIEKLENFRLLYRLLASKSSHTLQAEDIVSKETHKEIQLIGEFADVSYSPIALERVYKHLELLSQKHFPLEGYEAVTSSKLILSFEGDVANVAVLVAYRPTTKQIVVGICGTRTLMQALYDMNSLFQHCTKGGQSYRVHSGFMSMYTGIEARAFKGIRKGFEEEQVEELVITGHSMGGALSYYLAVGLLTSDGILPPGIRIKIVAFGSPRVGDQAFASLWKTLVEEHRSSHGRLSFQEYNVRAYNDGVPMLPPVKTGYVHHTTNPLFLRNDQLFRIPDSEKEYGSFDVPTIEDAPSPLYPKGGHNYYNGRELEKLARRVSVLSKLMKDEEDDLWVKTYVAEVTRVEKYSLS
ncbi:Alpha/Beta hydrolase protein [Thelephora terrestris]|uniref:Alpha/Beta hydrolase protein n=1 Tax=Thelephora terrestris TaxID=56493 RepID=A0A9P6L7Q7_9AGAM|nr:Alpha/Beta hydrolase protein [Thelephora terrestris]